MTNVRLDAKQSFMTRIRAKFATHRAQIDNSDFGLREWSEKYLKHYFFRAGCALHDTLNIELESLRHKRGQKTNIIAPRGFAKTTWVVAKVLKAICEGSEHYILLISDTGDQAEKNLASVKAELEGNSELRATYPSACAPGPAWNNSRIETQSHVCVEALGTGKKARGRKYRQWRPTLILGDDLDNDEDVQSPSTRQNHKDWWYKVILQCGDVDTNYVVVGTMIHRECIVGVLEKDPQFRTIKFQAVMKWPIQMGMWKTWESKLLSGTREVSKDGVLTYNSDDADDFLSENWESMSEGARVLWPEKADLLQLMQKWAGQNSSFASEYQNDPRDPSKCEFKEEWFDDTHKYDGNELANMLQQQEHVTIQFVDPAKGGEKARHDYCPIIYLHWFGTGKLYVEIDCAKRPINETIQLMLDGYTFYKPAVMGYEENGFQSLVGDNLLATAELQKMNVPDIEARLHGVQNFGVHKNTRIARLATWFERGFFLFKRNCPDTQLLIEQCLDFPNGTHDDAPDCLEGGLRICTEILELGSTKALGLNIEG
jgi:predicted phage terminase large subunit-like protein